MRIGTEPLSEPASSGPTRPDECFVRPGAATAAPKQPDCNRTAGARMPPVTQPGYERRRQRQNKDENVHPTELDGPPSPRHLTAVPHHPSNLAALSQRYHKLSRSGDAEGILPALVPASA